MTSPLQPIDSAHLLRALKAAPKQKPGRNIIEAEGIQIIKRGDGYAVMMLLSDMDESLAIFTLSEYEMEKLVSALIHALPGGEMV